MAHPLVKISKRSKAQVRITIHHPLTQYAVLQIAVIVFDIKMCCALCASKRFGSIPGYSARGSTNACVKSEEWN